MHCYIVIVYNLYTKTFKTLHVERFKCFCVKILDYYNTTVHSLVCNKLSVSKMHGATIKIKTNLSCFLKLLCHKRNILLMTWKLPLNIRTKCVKQVLQNDHFFV